MTSQQSSVDRAYDRLRDMTINFEFKPEERLNESTLTTALGTSRTPLREALNRLVAEGFLTFKNGRGFFCRALSPNRISDLYEARIAIETEAVKRGISRASDADIAELCTYLDQTEGFYDTCSDVARLVEMDEEFHLRLASLSGNGELLKMLKNVNDRIRYVRMINLRQLRSGNSPGSDSSAQLSAHRVVCDAVSRRDADAALAALRAHIERRSDQTKDVVRIAFSQLYVPSD